MGGTTERPPSHGTGALLFEGRRKVEPFDTAQDRKGRREPGAAAGAQPDSFGMFLLRLWMWAVPVLMFAAAAVFGGIAVADGKWGLFVVMLVMGCIAASLFVFHWWVMYRFGSRAR